MSLYSVAIAAGTPVSNTTAETSLGGATFPANFWQAGKVIKFSGFVRTTASDSTDTLVVKGKIGGTAFFTTAAVDQVNADVCVFSGVLVCRSAPGASAVIVGNGFYAPPDVSGTAALGWAAIASSLNTAAALAFDVTATWSVAATANSCQLESLALFEEI
jgi:hypothetical protein